MFLDIKYNLEKNKQECTNFVLKVLPQYLELKERKKLKEEIVSIKLLAQMNDTSIPNLENKEFIYRNIMYIEFMVKNIKKIQPYIETLHKLFKAPTILKISDEKLNSIYSLCIKRLSKIYKGEIVVENIVTTKEFSDVINTKTRNEYIDIISKIYNRNNKFDYYYELLIKTKIYNLKKELKDNYIKLLDSKIFYNLEKMQYNMEKLNSFEEYIKQYESETNMAEKIKLKNKIDNIIFIF